MRIINVPVELIRRLRWNKTSVEMLVCAIMIKRVYQNSVLYDLRVTSVMKFFGVSHKKAKKLIDAFKESDLFIYNDEKNCIFAKSFKSKTKHPYGRMGKYTAFADYCRKMQLEDTIKLRDAVRELRNILGLCVINATSYTKDNLMIRGTSLKNSVTEPDGRVAIPQAKLGYAMGFSRSSAKRYIDRMVEAGRVGKSGIVAECAISSLSEESEREYRESHPKQKLVVWHDIKNASWSAWIIKGNAYFVANRKDSDAFQHVIYNYKRGGNIEQTTSCELDGEMYWNRC